MRVAFILTVNFNVIPANPGEIVVLFNAKCALHQPPKFLVFLPGLHLDCKSKCHSRRPGRNRCVFQCKMCAAPTPLNSWCFLPGLHLDCKFKCHSRRPRRNRCVFSCKMRLAFILTVNLNVIPANPGEIVAFFNAKCTLYQPP